MQNSLNFEIIIAVRENICIHKSVVATKVQQIKLGGGVYSSISKHELPKSLKVCTIHGMYVNRQKSGKLDYSGLRIKQ